MKRFFWIIIVATSFVHVNAQFVVNDTVTTSAENKDMTFYSLATGAKTLVANNDWHLAFSVRPSAFPSNTLQGASIRINEALGVKVYQVLGFDEDSFGVSIDTTGFRTWQQLNDSDSLLDLGALNKGLNIGVFNYGWGTYSGPPNHNVVGTKVYLLELPGGSIKKLLIYQLDRDTAWDVKYANIDNSAYQEVRIPKRNYPGKNYVYLNLGNNMVKDKEPASSDWDLQFLRYAATDILSAKTVAITGVWSNKGTLIAKRKGVEVTDNNYSSLTFSPDMNTIGWNWKTLVSNQQYLSGKDVPFFEDIYRIEDSLAYFVQTLSGNIYKLVFTGYGGYSRGTISFYTESLTATSIAEPKENGQVIVFPNPCHSALNVLLQAPSIISVYDIAGKMIVQQTVSEKSFALNTSELANGIYLLAVTAQGHTSVNRFAVNH